MIVVSTLLSSTEATAMKQLLATRRKPNLCAVLSFSALLPLMSLMSSTATAALTRRRL